MFTATDIEIAHYNPHQRNIVEDDRKLSSAEKSKSVSTQCNKVKTNDFRCQTVTSTDAEIQVTPAAANFSDAKAAQPDWNRVAQFLHSVEPMVTKALVQNNKSTAFRKYEQALRARYTNEVENTHRLRDCTDDDIDTFDKDFGKLPGAGALSILQDSQPNNEASGTGTKRPESSNWAPSRPTTAKSTKSMAISVAPSDIGSSIHAHLDNEPLAALRVHWNASGTSVAAAMGFARHESWCSHAGNFIHIWNVCRPRLDATHADRRLQCDACATALRWHSAKPSMVAVGLHSGHVAVYDVARSVGDELLAGTLSYRDEEKSREDASAGINTVGHSEAVTCIQWRSGNELATCALDGLVIIFTLPDMGGQLRRRAALKINIGSLPRSLRPAAHGAFYRGSVDSASSSRPAGLTAIAFDHFDGDLFLAGGETGAVLHCSAAISSKAGVTAAANLDGSTHNPVVLSLKPHAAAVTAVCASMHRRSVFASSAADGVVRVYNAFKVEPVWAVQIGQGIMHSVCCSPSRPSVLALVTQNDGGVHLIDLVASEIRPIAGGKSKFLPGDENVPDRHRAMLDVSFNPLFGSTLASTDMQGSVHVWHLGDSLAKHAGSADETKLDQIAATAV